MTIITDATDKGQQLCDEWGLQIESVRRRRRKLMPGENAKDVGLSTKNRLMYTVIDRINTEMTTTSRFKRLKDLDDNFGFLLDVQNIKNIGADDLKGNVTI